MQHVWRNRLRQLIILLALVGTIGFSIYAENLPLGGRFQLQILRDLDLLIRPHNITFAAWIPVFAGLVAYGTYQLLPRQTGNGLHNRLLFWLLVALGGHCTWLYFWHLNDWAWALFGVFLQMDGLLAVYMRLGIGRIRVRRNETLFVRIPFSLYLGWTAFIATLTLTAFLKTVNWDPIGLSAEVWLLIVVTLVAMLIAGVAMRHRDFGLALIVIWCFAGIAVRHQNNLTVVLAIVILSAAMLLAVAAMPADQRPVI